MEKPVTFRLVVQWILFGLFGADVTSANHRWVRRERMSRLKSRTVFVAALIPLLFLTTWCGDRLLDSGAGSGAGFDRLALWTGSHLLALAIFATVTASLAYFPARAICVLVTFRLVTYQNRRCGNCGYDLTGNVSGTCPECGCAAKPAEGK